MRRTFTFLFSLIVGLSTLFAQNKGGKVVYSQMGATSFNQARQAMDNPNGWFGPEKTLSADDFEIVADGTEITGASFVTSFDPAAGLITSGVIKIYEHYYALPGTEIVSLSFTEFEAIELDWGKYENNFTFDETLVLDKGTYWISINCVGSTGEWFAIDNSGVPENEIASFVIDDYELETWSDGSFTFAEVAMHFQDAQVFSGGSYWMSLAANAAF